MNDSTRMPCVRDRVVWPFSVRVAAPVAASQSRTVQSDEADATSLPSGEKVMSMT